MKFTNIATFFLSDCSVTELKNAIDEIEFINTHLYVNEHEYVMRVCVPVLCAYLTI